MRRGYTLPTLKTTTTIFRSRSRLSFVPLAASGMSFYSLNSTLCHTYSESELHDRGPGTPTDFDCSLRPICRTPEGILVLRVLGTRHRNPSETSENPAAHSVTWPICCQQCWACKFIGMNTDCLAALVSSFDNGITAKYHAH